MPRRTRMYLPGIPVHVVQRGHNRQACFFSEDDYLFYKDSLSKALALYEAELHAYCLMTNHVHLLLTPRHEDSIQRVMQHLGREYVRYINKSYKRSGSLWEGRHKGSMVAEGDYLLRCYRYIELNPVTAAMVEKPEEYPWSSYPANAFLMNDALVTPHEEYLKLDKNDSSRAESYRELFKHALLEEDVHEISECLQANFLFGSIHFQEQIESALGKKVGCRKKGRPKKTAQK